MTPALDPESLAGFARLAQGHVLLAFDFDGTLAPLTANRHHPAMRAHTRALLRRACRSYPCAVVSGRALEDIRGRLARLPVKYLVGNHGIQPDAVDPRFERDVTQARQALERELQQYPGIDIEDKRYSLAIHYRQAPDADAAQRQIRRAAARLARPMRLQAGRRVLNLLPRDAPDKGDALRRLRRLEGADRVVFVGDDDTDEDVFRLHDADWLVSIRVGWSAASSATYYLPQQTDIDDLLEVFCRFRPPRPRSARPAPSGQRQSHAQHQDAQSQREQLGHHRRDPYGGVA